MENYTLFENIEDQDTLYQRPLAFRMRPKSFDEFVGQEHIVGSDKLLRKMIQTDCFQSIILWGPPGCGKNSLASLIAFLTRRNFVSINAVEANTNTLRKTVETAKFRLKQSGKRSLLFIDEIHRFNKAQQDLLLPYVEEGDIAMIGATTHNPVFSLITALRSRSHVFELKPLKKREIITVLKAAVKKEREKEVEKFRIEEGVFEMIAEKCGGDARIALNTLEIAIAVSCGDNVITADIVSECLPFAAVRYDKDESEHYDTISIFIKSMRGSDPDGAVYWLGKMIAGGEDPLFIARRLAIFASEDIGMADPRALQIADSTLRLVSEIGMPEARIILSHAAIYMATSPKSNASYQAIDNVLRDIQSHSSNAVPDFVRKTTEQPKNHKFPLSMIFLKKSFLKLVPLFVEKSM